MTGCVCEPEAFPFECPRHQCVKTEHWHMLCRTRADYVRLWEEGRGPGQHRPDEPGLLQKTINFAEAAARHLANGCRQVSDEVYERRISMCRACPSLDAEHMMCREFDCGCWVERKARWASEECPLQKWRRDEPVTQPPDPTESHPSSMTGMVARPDT
jgi:hypothetical protein